MQVAGIELRNEQIREMKALSPSKEQYRQRSISGANIEALTISYTHRYSLKLQNLSSQQYIGLYQALLTADKTDNGQITIDCTGEIRAGIVHYVDRTSIPSTIDFDFDITTISPEPYYEYSNMIISLSVYEAV